MENAEAKFKRLEERPKEKHQEACGIKVEGKNKWITLIQNAKTHKSSMC
jgi:hypothetical protein